MHWGDDDDDWRNWEGVDNEVDGADMKMGFGGWGGVRRFNLLLRVSIIY